MIWFFVMFVILLGVLVWLTRVREGFVDMSADAVTAMHEAVKVDPASLPQPQDVFKKVRALLDKYDRPEIWDHATQMMDKDPGQLARINLGLQ